MLPGCTGTGDIRRRSCGVVQHPPWLVTAEHDDDDDDANDDEVDIYAGVCRQLGVGLHINGAAKP